MNQNDCFWLSCSRFFARRSTWFFGYFVCCFGLMRAWNIIVSVDNSWRIKRAGPILCECRTAHLFSRLPVGPSTNQTHFYLINAVQSVVCVCVCKCVCVCARTNNILFFAIWCLVISQSATIITIASTGTSTSTLATMRLQSKNNFRCKYFLNGNFR